MGMDGGGDGRLGEDNAWEHDAWLDWGRDVTPMEHYSQKLNSQTVKVHQGASTKPPI